MFESILEGIFVTDGAGMIRACNRTAAEFLSIERHPSRCRPCWDIARLRTVNGAPFCGPDCPARRHAKGECVLGPVYRLLAENTNGLLLPVDMLAFPVAADGDHAPVVFHLLAPVRARAEIDHGHMRASAPLRQETLARPAAIDPPSAGDAQPSVRLSARERQVLQLMSRGVETTEIAASLFVSQVTVRNHIQNILRKLHVHRRLDAVLKWFREERSAGAAVVPDKDRGVHRPVPCSGRILDHD